MTTSETPDAGRAAAPAAHPAPPPGLRQRKKRRTRDELTRAALNLFLSQGYDRTTVDQITEAVEVHQRTFFRYFASKEEVALSPITGIDEAFLAALKERPARENPLEAMSASFRTVLDKVREDELDGVEADLHMAMMQLVETTPSLLSQRLRHIEEMEDQLVAVIAAREGLDADLDPRPRLIVAVFGAVGRAVSRAWYRKAEADLDNITEALQDSLDRLGPDLFGDWQRPPGAPH